MLENKKTFTKWLNIRFRDITAFRSNILPTYIHFLSKGKVVACYDSEKKSIGFDKNQVWFVLEEIFELKKSDIENVLKEWFKSKFDYVFYSVDKDYGCFSSYVEEEYLKKLKKDSLQELEIHEKSFSNSFLKKIKNLFTKFFYTLP